MDKEQSPLLLKSFSSIETPSPSSTVSDESSRSTKKTFSNSVTKLPDWLLDYHEQHYHHQANAGDHSKHGDAYRVRPLTENSSLSRPLWFQELLAARRHSEVLLPSSFEEEDMAFRLNSMDMDQEDSGGSSSDNVDIIMILDDDLDEMQVMTSNRGSRKSIVEDEDDKRSSSSGQPGRKNRSLSNFFDANDFKPNKRDLLRLTSGSPKDLSDVNLVLTLDSLALKGQERTTPNQSVFKRKNLLERDSHTAADIDLESLDDMEFESDFIIPELPEGKELVIDIKSNWGDDDYIGFNGIEIFELKTKCHPTIEQIFCENDEKSDAKRLIDGVYRTHDDNHIWITDYSPFTVTRIRVKFEEKISIVLIRLWNYNKSRIYSYRGIRFVTMTLDGVIIFKGEIAKALGELAGPPEKFGDTILFTTNESILVSVAANDLSFQELLNQNV